MPDKNNFTKQLDELKEKHSLTPQTLQKFISEILKNPQENKDETLKNVFIETVSWLRNSELLNKEYLKSLINAIINEKTKDLNETINQLNKEKIKILTELEKYQDKYNETLNNLLENIKIISDEMEEKIKKEVNESINELTSQNEKAIFEMQKNIINDIKKAVEENRNISDEVKNTINQNIQKALKNSQLTISQTKEIFKKAILSVKEISEELNLDMQKNLAIAIKSAEDYVLLQINKLKTYLDESNDIKEIIQKDVLKSLENLEIIYIGMIEAIGDFSQKNEKILQEELEDMRKKIAEIKSEVKEIIIQKIEILRIESGDALNRAKEKTKILTDEMKEKFENLSTKIAKITKGAINGMIEGAKKAMEEDKH